MSEFFLPTTELDLLAEEALDHARKLGAEEACVDTSISTEQRLVVEGDELTLVQGSESHSLSLLVHKNQKQGSAGTNSLAKKDLKKMVQTALDLASFSLADPALNLPKPDVATEAKPLPFLYDKHLEGLKAEELEAVIQEAIALFKRDKRVAMDRIELEVSLERLALSNSHGVRQNEMQAMVQWDFAGMARDGDEVANFDYESGFSFSRSDFRERFLAEAESFKQLILGNLNPVVCPSYKGPVILSPRMVEELLLESILYHASGRNVMDGKSRWERSIGKKVISDHITIGDSPHDKRMLGATSYDDDGLPTKDLVFFEKGILKAHLHDCYTAKKMGTKSTHSAGGPFSIVVKGGNAGDEIFSARKEILFADRFSGNVDPLTGDFSGVAKSSRLYRQGKLVGPVTETMIAGNVFHLFSNVLAVSKEQTLVNGALLAPVFLADGVTVSGA